MASPVAQAVLLEWQVVMVKVEVRVAGLEVVTAMLNVVGSAVVAVSVGSSVVAVSVGSSEVVAVLVGFPEVVEELGSSPTVHLHQFLSGFNTSTLPSQAFATQSSEPSMICLRVFDSQAHSGSPSSHRL